ncbi:MAG: DNA repair protein RadC [Candidatus Krumholzibacteriia bacterium]
MNCKEIRDQGGGSRRVPAPRHGPGAPAARERLLSVGPRPLAAWELLALVLGPGASGPAGRVASALLERWGSPAALAAARPLELLALPGMDRGRTARVSAALELGRRAAAAAWQPGLAVRGPHDLAPVLLGEFGRRRREHFVAVYLDARHRVVTLETVAVGTLDASLVHPREVFRPAVALGAAAVVVAHNHPSGCAQPSRDDLELTARLDRCGRLLGIELLDHLVVGASEVLSLRETGWPDVTGP